MCHWNVGVFCCRFGFHHWNALLIDLYTIFSIIGSEWCFGCADGRQERAQRRKSIVAGKSCIQRAVPPHWQQHRCLLHCCWGLILFNPCVAISNRIEPLKRKLNNYNYIILFNFRSSLIRRSMSHRISHGSCSTRKMVRFEQLTVIASVGKFWLDKVKYWL